VTVEERRRDRLAGVFGLALAGITAATLVAGPIGAAPPTPDPAPTSGHTWRPSPVDLGIRLISKVTRP
jgi:hypothetical protein